MCWVGVVRGGGGGGGGGRGVRVGEPRDREGVESVPEVV